MERWRVTALLFWSAWLLLARQARAVHKIIDGGGGHSCAIMDNRTLRCWGLNNYGQLGYGDTMDRGEYSGDMGNAVVLGGSVRAVALGTFHSCALLMPGNVKCWGYGFYGQLGYGDKGNKGDKSGDMYTGSPSVQLSFTAIAITAGGYHTCALLNTGGGTRQVKCWGANQFGQLGLGDNNNRGDEPGEMGDFLPVVPLGESFNPIAIAAGTYFTCALSSSNQINCWGANDYGQLGQGHNAHIGDQPGEMQNLPPIKLGAEYLAAGITAGGNHACALLMTGAVKCWGENTYGQLGYEDSAHRGRSPLQMDDNLLPVDLGTARTAVAIETGLRFTCALLDNGDVKCWGYNSEGQLGQGHPHWRGLRADEMGDNLLVTNLTTSHTVYAIAAGDFHAMAVLDDGTLKCWGAGANGRLGIYSTTNRGDEPNEMGDDLPEADLAIDVFETCELGFRGAVDFGGCTPCPPGTWGLAAADIPEDCTPCYAGYSPSSNATQCTPCPVGKWSSQQGKNTAALAQCTDCTPGKYAEFPASPACLGCPAGTASDETGADSKEDCEVCSAGSYNDVPGSASCQSCPSDSYSLPGWSTCLACPRGTYLAGSGVCEDCPAGFTSDASSTSPDDCYEPTFQLARGGSLRVLDGGMDHSCAVLELGFVKCWGSNNFGQLGYGDPAPRGRAPDQMGSYLPTVDLALERSAVSVAVGAKHSCALLDDGSIKCWGNNEFGQLGQGDKDDRGDEPGDMGENLDPVDLGQDRFAIAIAAAKAHTCAVLDNNSVKCWGNNAFGQLGLGAPDDRGDNPGEMGDNLPAVDLGTGFKAIAIAAGDDNTCALATTGQVKCWGANTRGQLGQGNSVGRGLGPNEMGDKLPPVNLGPAYFAVAIAAGAQHNCALLDNGSVKCWGANDAGQLGYGDNRPRGLAPNEMGVGLPPIDLGGNLTAVAIAAGEQFTCALLNDGALKCWGANQFGQLGQGDNLGRGDNLDEMGENLPPIDLGTGRTVKALAAGTFHVMALLDNSSVKCWGLNGDAQLGLGDVVSRGSSLTDMGANLPVVDLGASSFPVCEPGSFGQRSCDQCPSGKWGLAGAATSDECVFCRAGYSVFPGSTQCVSCVPGTSSLVQNATSEAEANCEECVAGKYADYPGSPVCTDCGPGKYCDHEGGTKCTPCGAGKYSSEVGLTDESQCGLCPAGRYSELEGATFIDQCLNCQPGTFSPDPGASSRLDCQACPIGTYAEGGNAECEQCEDGYAATEMGSPSCHECEGGAYSVYTECVQCPAGRSSLPGSANEDNCESLTTSFAVGTALMAATGVIVLVYIIAGRAAKLAANERQSALMPIIRACSTISAHILATMKRRREAGVVWQFLVVMLLTVALFVITLLTFLTNTFLLSRSFLATPAWVTELEEHLAVLIEKVPLLGFLFIVPPIIRLIESIDFGDLMDGVDVSCSGAQAPMFLFTNALIMVGTVVMIDSQLHTVLALALSPAMRLTRDKLISMPDTELIIRVKNITRFLLLLVVSAFFQSFSRYTMQVFATLINYSDFYPYHKWTEACNQDDKTDEWLATVSTILFYAAALPVLLLIIPVMMPGLPGPLAERAQSRPKGDAARLSMAGSQSRPVFQRLLDCINPFRWVLFGVNWLLTSLYGHAAMQPPDKRAAQRLDLAQSSATKERKVIGFTAFLKSWFCFCCRKDTVSPFQIIATCAWKVKLSLYLAFGVWTDEIVQNLQIDQIAQQHFDWTPDHTRSYEDVMAAAGPMRSMVWMLVPFTVVLTKLSEATNTPPVFVRSGFVKMTSPVLFKSWKEAEAVMLEGRALLNMYSVDDKPDSEAPGCASGFEHNLLVMLVWIFGARLPQYCVNVIVLLLAASTAIKPLLEVLVLAVCILFPWAVLYALAMVLDVTTMLSLRKLINSSDKPGLSQNGAIEFVPVARAVPADGATEADADISAFYPSEKHVVAAEVL